MVPRLGQQKVVLLSFKNRTDDEPATEAVMEAILSDPRIEDLLAEIERLQRELTMALTEVDELRTALEPKP
jgi:hypothetical protein